MLKILLYLEGCARRQSLFKFNNSTSTKSVITRGHMYKLTKSGKCSTESVKFSNCFSNKVVNLWNNLPQTGDGVAQLVKRQDSRFEPRLRLELKNNL